MKLVTYKTVKDFLIENESLLMENEAINQLMLFNAKVNQEASYSQNLVFGNIRNEAQQITLIFFYAHPYNLIVYAIGEVIASEPVHLLVEHLVKNKIAIRGINAQKAICDLFTNDYHELTNLDFSCHLEMDIMELRQLNDVTLPLGYFRLAQQEDLDLLVKWDLDFSLEATGEILNYETSLTKMKARMENEMIYVFENANHEIVSMAAMTRQLVNGVSISLVYTNPTYRNKGYGLAVVHALSKVYLEKGNKFCTLFVDKTNPISNKVYQKLGYKIIQDHYDYRLIAS